jgi:hypothetical protein
VSDERLDLGVDETDIRIRWDARWGWLRFVGFVAPRPRVSRGKPQATEVGNGRNRMLRLLTWRVPEQN